MIPGRSQNPDPQSAVRNPQARSPQSAVSQSRKPGKSPWNLAGIMHDSWEVATPKSQSAVRSPAVPQSRSPQSANPLDTRRNHV